MTDKLLSQVSLSALGMATALFIGYILTNPGDHSPPVRFGVALGFAVLGYSVYWGLTRLSV